MDARAESAIDSALHHMGLASDADGVESTVYYGDSATVILLAALLREVSDLRAELAQARNA